MVAMNRLINSAQFRKVLDQNVLPYVEAKLPGLHFRLHKSYSLLLMVTNVVRNGFLIVVPLVFKLTFCAVIAMQAAPRAHQLARSQVIF